VATCSAHDIRLWNVRKGQELLRITVPNMVCNAIAIMRDGKSIVSGTSQLCFSFRYCYGYYGYFITHFYRAMHFSAKRGIAIACRLSVSLSVRL